jgi:hypothetical protein
MRQSIRDLAECIGCGLKSDKVEAAGIYYCPNPLCRASGGAWFRRKLTSYQEISPENHSVDLEEWLFKGWEEVQKTSDRALLKAAKKRALEIARQIWEDDDYEF